MPLMTHSGRFSSPVASLDGSLQVPSLCAREGSVMSAPRRALAEDAFKQQFELQGVHFVVDVANEGSLHQLTVTSTGFQESNEQAL
jgi:hypothetical protein